MRQHKIKLHNGNCLSYTQWKQIKPLANDFYQSKELSFYNLLTYFFDNVEIYENERKEFFKKIDDLYKIIMSEQKRIDKLKSNDGLIILSNFFQSSWRVPIKGGITQLLKKYDSNFSFKVAKIKTLILLDGRITKVTIPYILFSQKQLLAVCDIISLRKYNIFFTNRAEYRSMGHLKMETIMFAVDRCRYFLDGQQHDFLERHQAIYHEGMVIKKC